MFSKLPIILFTTLILPLLTSTTSASPLTGTKHSTIHPRTQTEKITCSPSNSSPFLTDAQNAASLLAASLEYECYGGIKPSEPGCRQLQCYKSACIGRCPVGKWGHLSQGLSCKEVAGYAMMILQDESCLTEDLKKVGGNLQVTTPASYNQVHLNDINVYTSRDWIEEKRKDRIE